MGIFDNRFFIKLYESITPNRSSSLKQRRRVSHASEDNSRMVWIDLELTGLDVNTDQIMEIACVITDFNLQVINDGLDLVVYQPPDVLANMGEWCTAQHKKTGLTEACRDSSLMLKDADHILTDYIQKHTFSGARNFLAGNSVYTDRWFVKKHLPNADSKLYYRIIDVSSIKELCKKWNYDKYILIPPKKMSHRAMDDIRESIEELRFYRAKFFNLSDENEK